MVGTKLSCWLLLSWALSSVSAFQRTALPVIVGRGVTGRGHTTIIQQIGVNCRCRPSRPWEKQQEYNSVAPSWQLLSLRQSASSTSSPALESTAAAVQATDETDHDDPARSKRRLAAGLAFLAGFSNVAFMWEFQTFATMLTGNLLRLTRSIVEHQHVLTLYYVSVFASYLGGVTCLRLMRHKQPKTILRFTAVAVAVMHMAADVLYFGGGSSAAAAVGIQRKWLPITLLSACYGMINSASTDFAGTLAFVVTGHFTKLTHLVTDWIVERKPFTAVDTALAKQSGAVVGGFFGGALVALYLNSRNVLFQRGMFSMVGLMYGLIFVSYDGKRIKRWWKRRQVPDMAVIQVVVNDEVISDAGTAAAIMNMTLSPEDELVMSGPIANATISNVTSTSDNST